MLRPYYLETCFILFCLVFLGALHKINGCICSVRKNIRMNFEYRVRVPSSFHLGINIHSNFAINPPSLYAKTVVEGSCVICQLTC